MSDNLIQYAFISGEMSGRLFGRTDFDKYEFGMAKSENWFVDYRGGLSTRPGLEFMDQVQYPDYPTRIVKFQYSPDISNTYIVLFGHGYIRFLQDGSYVLESDKTITNITRADPIVVVSNGHGYSVNDLVKISGVAGMTEINDRTFVVASKTNNTFTLKTVADGVAIDSTNYTAYSSGGVVARVYTVTNPYDASDLNFLRAYQIRDTLRLTHGDYPVYDLTREDHASWTITAAATGTDLDRPTISSHTVMTAGTAGAIYAVTAIFADGSESLPSDNYYVTNTNNFSVEQGSVTIQWNTVTDAVAYKVYRSIISSKGADLTNAQELGYVSTTRGSQFTDNNYVPDFTGTPPSHYDPFVVSTIESITITNGGSGYATTTTSVSVSGAPGSGFIGLPLVVGGAVVAILIINGGKNYVSPTVTITGAGTGATATATVSSANPSYPKCSTLFQQRQLYAGMANDPLTIIGSKPGQFYNFDAGTIVTSGDSFEFTLVSQSVSPIRHLIDMRGGLLVMNASTVWQLTGANGIVSPTSALAEPQTFFGVSELEPINIDTEILYQTNKGGSVRLLAYNDFSKLYGGVEISVLSNHLLAVDNQIIRWSFAETPYRLVHCVRADGTWLTFTCVTEHKVYAWTPNKTQGFVTDCIVIEEDGRDSVYKTVTRYINGVKNCFIERDAIRDVADIEDAFCVDSGLKLGATYPATSVNITGNVTEIGGAVTVTAGSSIFSSGTVGDILRAGGGKIEITGYTSGSVVTGIVRRPLTAVIPYTTTLLTAEADEWTLDTPVTNITGLWHLEGMTVKVVGDGSVQPDKTVTNGSITLTTPATRVSVGLGYECIAQTLPLNATSMIIEGRLRAIIGVVLRYHQSRGIKIGATLDDLSLILTRTTEMWGQPVELRDANAEVLVAHTYDRDGQMYMVQDQPLPATVLGVVFDVDIGDDTR